MCEGNDSIEITETVLSAALEALSKYEIASDYVDEDMMREVLVAAFRAAKEGSRPDPVHPRTQTEG
jgi:hypothetical protein